MIGKARLSKEALGLAAFVALYFAAAGIGWVWADAGRSDWYPSLRKPGWTPPGRLVGPVWSILSLTTAVAGWLVWRRRHRVGAKVALLLFAVQLGLKTIWAGLFFSLRDPSLAFGEIALLWLAVVATMMAFWRINRVAALLMVPDLFGVTFASVLNLVIWMMNS